MDEINPNLERGKCVICGSPAVTEVDGEYICEKGKCFDKIIKKLGYIEVSEEFLLNMESDSDVPQRELTPEEAAAIDKSIEEAFPVIKEKE